MSVLVVDASVVAKIYFPEAGSEAAEAALQGSRSELVAPDLLWAEIGSIAWKRARRGEISESLALRVIEAAAELPVRSVPIHPLAARATEIALQTGCSVYDSLYLAVAIGERGVVLSADGRFVNAVRSGPYAAFVRLLGE